MAHDSLNRNTIDLAARYFICLTLVSCALPNTTAFAENSKPSSRSSSGSSILWAEVFGGYSYVNLGQFHLKNFLPSVASLKGSGFVGGGALGVRILFFTLGARATYGSYPSADLGVGTVGADIGLRLPAPFVEPYFRLGLGYAWIGSAGYEVPSMKHASVHGLEVDAGLGADFFILRWLGLGFGVDAVFLNLHRQKIDPGCGAGTCAFTNVRFEENGDAAGLQIRGQLHFILRV